jgi:L-rhamnose mutarotase
MKDFAMSVNLKDDEEVIAKYKAYHAHPFPEVIDAFKKVGVLDMKIYLLGRRLFMFVQTEDHFNPETDFSKYLSLHPRCQEWEDLMSTFQEKLPEAKPHEKWAMMEKVFQL